MKKRAVILLLAGVLAVQTVLLGACGSGAAEAGSLPETVTAEAKSLSETVTADTEVPAVQAGKEDAVQESGDGSEEMKEEAGESRTAEETEAKADVRHEDGVNGFAFRFTKEMLAQKADGENLIVSPYSVWLPLAALANGTDEAAKEALLSALGSAGMDTDALNEGAKQAISALTCEEQAEWSKENGQKFESPLKIANALFVDQNARVNPEFETIFERDYAGKLFSVDFADEDAAGAVNDWAKEQTEGKIDQVIDSFDPQTVAAIANAIYFSDGWAKSFPKENTTQDIFKGSTGEQEVPFMYREFQEIPYYEDAKMQAAALGTATGANLILLLPKEGQSAEELLASMDAEKFGKLTETGEATVQLSLPKFKVESDVMSVKETLERMGVPLMDELNPHLDQVVDQELLFISEAVQKAMIEVDEEGMTAAAVTVMALQRMSMRIDQEPVEMKCDRPFAFLLSANGSDGQQVLFAGVVNQIGQ